LIEHEEEIIGDVEDSRLLIEPFKSSFGNPLDYIVSKVSLERKMGRDKVIERIYELNSKGLIKFVDPNPPRSLMRYIFSLYSLLFWIIEGFIALTAASIYLLPSMYPFIYLRAVAGVIFVIFIPGYVFIETLFLRKTELDKLIRLILSISMSILIVSIVGLVINYTPWGINLDPALAFLIILVSAMGIISVYRKYDYWKLELHAR
jgi:hypothetical protein